MTRPRDCGKVLVHALICTEGEQDERLDVDRNVCLSVKIDAIRKDYSRRALLACEQAGGSFAIYSIRPAFLVRTTRRNSKTAFERNRSERFRG
jgi:hypothetical protein